jgi:agmatine deiminase
MNARKTPAAQAALTPRELGYYWPAEWEKQRAIWLAWPHNTADWPGKFPPIPWVYVEFVRSITQGQNVGLVIKNQAMRDTASDMLERGGVNMERVEFLQAPTNRIWLRDSGPIFLRRAKANKHGDAGIAALHWKFNAWAKYANHQLDAKMPEIIGSLRGVERIQPTVLIDGKPTHIVLEGGAIDGNGKGTLLTTEECLLSSIQERNPGLDRAGYEKIFHDYLSIDTTIWLDKGIVGDDTHGHVDDIARFVSADTIVAVVEPNKRDANNAILGENIKRLKKARDAKGKPFNVVELPMPAPVFFEGERLPASYANFLITNEAVLVPTFNDPLDRTALNILAECFPKRDVIGIPCRDFVWGLGTLHCASQQEPAA